MYERFGARPVPAGASSVPGPDITLIPGRTHYVNLKAYSSPSLCADIAGASDDNGAMLQLYNCTGNTNQQFYGLSVLTS